MNLPAYGGVERLEGGGGIWGGPPGPGEAAVLRWSDPSYNRSIREADVVLGGRRRRP